MGLTMIFIVFIWQKWSSWMCFILQARPNWSIEQKAQGSTKFHPAVLLPEYSVTEAHLRLGRLESCVHSHPVHPIQERKANFEHIFEFSSYYSDD